MGTFNALIAVKAEQGHIDSNLAIHLERLVRPWAKGRFDWYSMGVIELRFAVYVDPVGGWLEDDEMPDPVIAPHGHVLIPIRCHF